MGSLQQRLRRRQHMESLCATTLRALSGEADVAYRGRQLFAGGMPLRAYAPHLRVTDDDGFMAYRGAADGMALRLRFSDSERHRALEPEAPVARLIFDWLEQFRVESLAPTHMPGVADNVAQRFTDWSLAFHQAQHTDGAIGELVYTVVQMCWARISGRPVIEATEGLIETRRGELAPQIGRAIAGLRRTRRDQAAFADHALTIAAYVAERIEEHGVDGADEADDDNDRSAFSLLLDFEDEPQEGFAAAVSGDSQVFAEARQRYRAFSTAYDVEEPVESAVRGAQLDQFRARLDGELAELPTNLRRLARFFMFRLAVAESRDWRFGEEAGYIDGRRLAQVVSSPAERRVFKLEQPEPRTDAAVSFLVDCSGSMKAHGEFVALLLDRLTTALAMAGAATEILGFTTGAWSGGRVQREWMQAGRPAAPGRLNELRHLVFKPARQPWRRARRSVGALLKPDLYREGVDGEAVEWACARLYAQSQARRILIVISDGCPMDTSTQLANDSYYLDNHLKQVVARHSREGLVEIRGLGVGLDLSPFYPQSLIVDPQAPIDNTLLAEIAALITGPAGRVAR